MSAAADLRERIARLAAERAGAPALAGGPRTPVAWRDLPAAIDAAARALHPDSPTALLADNSPEAALLHLASIAFDRPLVPIAGFASDLQAAHALRAAGVARVVTDAPDRVATWCDAAGPRRASGLGGLTEIDLRPAEDGPAECRVTFTSGTTGAPKGARIPRRALLDVATSLAAVTQANPSERHLALLPLAVLLEETGGLLRTLFAGGTVLLPPIATTGLAGSSAIDGAQLVAAITRHRATSLVCVPQSLDALVGEAERGGAPPSLRFVGVGGAKVPPSLLERAARVGVPAFEGYGLTEAASVVALNAPGAVRRGTVGRPLPHVRVRVDASGEIHVAGAVFAGYVGSDDRPAADGSWATGDVGSIDADGYLRISGRRRNVFITSFGRNVSPEWVESRLAGCPSIAQCVVVGEGLPRPVAIVVARGGAADVGRDIARAAADLPDYARPAAWVAARRPFTAESGLATPGGRPLRDAISALHAADVRRALAPVGQVAGPKEVPWGSTPI